LHNRTVLGSATKMRKTFRHFDENSANLQVGRVGIRHVVREPTDEEDLQLSVLKPDVIFSVPMSSPCHQ